MEDLMTPDITEKPDANIILPADKSYLECNLPAYLEESVNKMKKAWSMIDSGRPHIHWDCDFCELQSDINTAEMSNLISEEQAWYLREKYLRMERSDTLD